MELPYYPLKDIVEKSTRCVKIQLFKTTVATHNVTSEIVFRKFKYPEETRILKKYGKYIRIINKIKDWENDYKYLTNINKITNWLPCCVVPYLNCYPTLKQIKVKALN